MMWDMLQTHNVAMASPIAEFVISLSAEGQIASRGSISDALVLDDTLAHQVKEEVLLIEKDKEDAIVEEQLDATAKQADGKLILAEDIAEGHVSW
jgi:hypothetical protein